MPPQPKKKPAAAAATKPPIRPKKTPARSQERITDSSSEGEGETLEETTSFETTTGKSASSSSSSVSSSEDENDDNDKDPVVPKPSYTYTPPSPFKPLPSPATTATTTPNPFTPRNLAGKELWFITAPVAAPLSKVDVVNPADIAEGAPILQTGSGRSYTLRALEEGETAEGGVMLAVQDGKGGYRIEGTKIAKSFQLVETLPVVGEGAGKGVKEVRGQPEGLWMRFKPIGWVGKQGEDGNVEVRERKRRRGEKEGEGGKEKRKHRSKEKHPRPKERVQV